MIVVDILASAAGMLLRNLFLDQSDMNVSHSLPTAAPDTVTLSSHHVQLEPVRE